MTEESPERYLAAVDEIPLWVDRYFMSDEKHDVAIMRQHPARLVPASTLASGDVATAAPLHAEDYQLITPNGSDMTKADYLGAIGAGTLRYRIFEPVSEIAVLGDGPLAVLRYRARIGFDDGPGVICWHTDCYRRSSQTWQAVCSQATRLSGLARRPRVRGDVPGASTSGPVRYLLSL